MSDERAFAPRRATVTLPRAWLHWVPVALLPVALFVFGGIAMLVIGALAAMIAWRFFPRRLTGLLRVDAAGLSVDGVPVVTLDRVWQAVRFTRATSAIVYVLPRRSFPIEVTLATDDDARELITALSMDDARATAHFRAWSGGMRARTRLRAIATLLPFGAVLASVFLLAARTAGSFPLHAERIAAGMLALGVIASFAIGLVAFSKRVQLDVGADGVLVRRGLGRSVFHPYREMRDVGLEQKDVVWTRASAASATLRFGIEPGRGWLPTQAKDLAKACFTRIVDARARHLAGEVSSDLATVLARGDRDVAAWRKGLEALLSDAVTYRTAALSPVRLWRVLEDPTQPEAARAGAAVALRASLDDEAKGRLRVATAACASSELRGAFEATLEDDADEVDIERALRAFRGEAR